MKKVLKYIGITLGGLIGLLLIALAFIGFKPLPNYQDTIPVPTNIEVKITPERVQNGEEISSVLCNHCHGNAGKLEGKLIAPKTPFGEIYAPNITQDASEGVRNYTDAELYRLLRTGILKDGRLALPMMSRLPNASEEDIYSIIAFLKSEEAPVQASSHKIPGFQPNLFSKLLYTLAFKPLPLPENKIQRPDPVDPVKYGYYLSTALYICGNCHSSSFETYNSLEPEKSPGFFAGGNPAAIGDMEPVISANLTMDQEEGIGSWSADDFLTALKYGKKPDGSHVKYPMVPYAFMDSADAYAIYEYLKTIPIINSQKKAEISQ